MLRHRDIWRALDALAKHRGMTPSGLARRSGLDPTAFNKSKRVTAEGRPRWPGTESLSKVLGCTNSTMAEFAALLGERGGRRLQVLGSAKAGAAGYFDDGGYPAGRGWDTVEFPGVEDPHAYALKVAGSSMEPTYRAGDILVVSPSSPPGRGDRVVLRTRRGEVMAKELIRRGPKRVELKSLNRAEPDRSLAAGDVVWMARILWVSQ